MWKTGDNIYANKVQVIAGPDKTLQRPENGIKCAKSRAKWGEHMEGQTIVAVATPPGQGGIAVVRLSGPKSVEIASKIFVPQNARRIINKMPGYTAAYGEIRHLDRRVDDGVLLLFRAPASFTGEDVVELSCHGGTAVTGAVLEACVHAGAQPAGPGEFTRRAYENGKLSLTQAEAVMELVSAEGRQAASLAGDGLAGALHRTVLGTKERLVTLAGHLAAYVDYPEEDVEELTEGRFLQVVETERKNLENMINGYQRGMVLRQGVRAAIVGSPNVGKSTIFNLLAGFDRSIVTQVAGTTRDVVREQVQIGGILLHLADTAGLHETEDVVEQEGIRRSGRELEQASLVIAVFDGSQPFGEQERQLAEQCAGRLALGVVNKNDLPQIIDENTLNNAFKKLVFISALDDKSVETLENAIWELLEIAPAQAGSELIANQRQLAAAVEARDALAEAQAALAAGYSLDAAGVCLDDTLQALARLSGEDVSEAVIEEVFSKFCVGK